MKNISKIPCVCVLRTRRSVLTFCQDSKIVSVAIQNPNALEHLRKIQCGKIVIEFTVKLNLKKYLKISRLISGNYIKMEVKPKW